MAVTLKRSKRITIGKDIELEKLNSENLKLLKMYKRDMLMRELSEKSIYNYEKDILQWFKYLYKEQFNPSVLELTEDEIEEFIFFCKEEGNNTERIRRRFASISAFYKFLRRKKKVQENPLEFIPRPKKGLPVVEQTYLTKEQFNELKDKLRELGNLQLEVYARLSLTTMGRVNAISNITWEQIDFESRTINDVLEKEGKIVTLFFDEEVKELLIELKKFRENHDIECNYVFCTKYNKQYKQADVTTLRSWASKVGKIVNVKLHPHDFRHSYATLLVNNGMPIEVVSSLLNHSGLDVTRKHYIKQDTRKLQEDKDKFAL